MYYKTNFELKLFEMILVLFFKVLYNLQNFLYT